MDERAEMLSWIFTALAMGIALVFFGKLSQHDKIVKSFNSDTELYCKTDTDFTKVKKSEDWKLVDDNLFYGNRSFKISDCHLEN